MSDYLWDKSGTPDPEVERLERLLEPFRYRSGVKPIGPRRPRASMWVALGAAAAVLAAVGLWRMVRPVSEAWSVSVVRAEGPSRTMSLRSGQTLETASGETAHMSLAHVGNLDVEPSTLLRVVTSRSNQQRFALVRGTIHAHIGAAPRVFIVSTPSATATDLGCAYTLHVEPSGDGILRVTSGLIEFDWDGRRALVPSGALALTRVGTGPGTPFFGDASAAFRDALASFDFEPGTRSREAALRVVLNSARRRDAVTLLNLVRTVDASRRAAVLERLAQLSPPPATVDMSAVVSGRFESLQPWWNALGLGHHPEVQLF